MRLYHFTAERFVPGITKHGITRGYVLIGEMHVLIGESPVRFHSEYRWLTANPEWEQEWAEGTGRLHYRRNEVRLSVDVPAESQRNVLKWTAVGPLLTPAYDILSAFGDPQNWRLFRGNIPATWITVVERNPSMVSA